MESCGGGGGTTILGLDFTLEEEDVGSGGGGGGGIFRVGDGNDLGREGSFGGGPFGLPPFEFTLSIVGWGRRSGLGLPGGSVGG